MSSIPRPRHYVYTLARPDGTVFYVGKGTGNRALEHLNEASKHTCYCQKCRIIHTIQSKRQEVIISYVLETDDNKAALDYEMALIQQYSTGGTLVNKTHTRNAPTPKIDLAAMSIDEYIAHINRTIPNPAERTRFIRNEIQTRIRIISDSVTGRGANFMRKDKKQALEAELEYLISLLGAKAQLSFL